MINTMELDHNSHSVFLVYYHLVMVIKYRRKVRNGKISERAKEIFEYIAPGYGIVPEEWNHDTDHVHVMFLSLIHILVFVVTVPLSVLFTRFMTSRVRPLYHDRSKMCIRDRY